MLSCRFATGTDADLIQQLAVRGGEGLTGWVARNRRALVNAQPSADLEAAGVTERVTSLRSALVCPLLLNEKFIGALSVYHVEPSFYRDDHRRLLDRVSEQAAAVIYNSLVYERTREDALTDPLTGLPNTRFLFMHLPRELARAERLGAEVSLIVMYLADVAELNERYGHAARDWALCALAQILKLAIRPYDICVRYEECEFMLVLSGCGREEAERKMRELQAAFAAVPFEPRPGEHVQLRMSAGTSVFPQDGANWEALMAAADERLRGARRTPERGGEPGA